MVFILKYVIVFALLYLLYRKFCTNFIVKKEISAIVEEKFITKNGQSVNKDDVAHLESKEQWKYYVVIKEFLPNTATNEDIYQDIPIKLTEEVSEFTYVAVEIGDTVKYQVDYGYWSKKVIRKHVIPVFNK